MADPVLLTPYINQATAYLKTAGAGPNLAVVSKVFTAILMLAIFDYGVKLYKGEAQIDTGDWGFKLVKLGLIGWAVFSIANPQSSITLASAVSDLPSIIGSLVGADINPASKIDNMLATYVEIVKQMFKAAGNASFAQFGVVLVSIAVAILTALIGVLVCASAFGIYLFAQIAMFLAVAFSPLAVMCMLFKPLNRFFGNWVGFTATAAVMFSVNALIMGLVFSVIVGVKDNVATVTEVTENIPAIQVDGQGASTESITYNKTDVNFSDLMILLIMSVVGGLAISRSEQYAAGLAGGASAAAQGAVALIVGGGVKLAAAAAGPAATAGVVLAKGGYKAGKAAFKALTSKPSGGAGGSPGGNVRPTQSRFNTGGSSKPK